MMRDLRPPDAAKCILVLPDISARPLLPMLHTIAAASGHLRVEVFHPDSGLEPLSVAAVPRSLAAVLGATASNVKAIRRARRELAALVAEPRIDVELRPGKRVLYLSGTLWFGLQAGGSVGHIAGVANGLAAAGHRVELAAMSVPPLLKQSVRPMRLDAPGVLSAPFEANGYRFSQDVVRQLRPVLTSRPASFLYERLSASNYAGVVLSRATRTPLVLEYNGSEAWVARHWGRSLRYHELALAAEDVCLKHAHAVVTVSEVLRDDLVQRGVAPERIAWYPNCIDPDIFAPERYGSAACAQLREQLGIPVDATVVTFVGTFGQWHGVDMLARAIVSLVGVDGAWLERNRVRFLLVGDGLKSSEVSSILGDNDRCSRFVVRTGVVPQDQAPAHLAASDIVVSPHVPNPDGSRFFGSPTKLFEYMAMEKSIIASDLDQIGSVLQPSLRVEALPHGEPEPGTPELALLVAPAEVAELAMAIRFLVTHPQWRGVLGANARARALARYTWHDHVAVILERLRAVLDGTNHEQLARLWGVPPEAPSGSHAA